MSRGTWDRIDLEGGGLQTANVRLAALLRRSSVAYALLLAFPVGAHCVYLRAPSRSLYYVVLSAVAGVLTIALGARIGAVPVVAAAALALYDALRWIPRRTTELNKEIRMQVYLSQGAGAPPGYRGRFPEQDLDDYIAAKERERAGHAAPGDASAPAPRTKPPSFAEQEAMLRELKRRERKD